MSVDGECLLGWGRGRRPGMPVGMVGEGPEGGALAPLSWMVALSLGPQMAVEVASSSPGSRRVCVCTHACVCAGITRWVHCSVDTGGGWKHVLCVHCKVDPCGEAGLRVGDVGCLSGHHDLCTPVLEASGWACAPGRAGS